jgi:hypothetical protein
LWASTVVTRYLRELDRVFSFDDNDVYPSEVGVRLQVLLKTAWRNEIGYAAVTRVLKELGIVPTASGAASLSVRLSPATFAKVFKVATSDLEAQASSGDESVLPVPPPLREFVESITIAPQHLYLRERDTDPGEQS